MRGAGTRVPGQRELHGGGLGERLGDFPIARGMIDWATGGSGLGKSWELGLVGVATQARRELG